jgi:hypothetical protein
MYASLLGISDALHLAVFDQPALQVFFSNLPRTPLLINRHSSNPPAYIF